MCGDVSKDGIEGVGEIKFFSGDDEGEEGGDF